VKISQFVYVRCLFGGLLLGPLAYLINYRVVERRSLVDLMVRTDKLQTKTNEFAEKYVTDVLSDPDLQKKILYEQVENNVHSLFQKDNREGQKIN